METPRDGYCCGRYASYWNAFLLFQFLIPLIWCAGGDTGDDTDSGFDTEADEECDAAGMSDCYSILDINDPDFLCR